MKIVNKKIVGNWVSIQVVTNYWVFLKYNVYAGCINREGNVFIWVSEPSKKRVSPEMELRLCKLLSEYKN